jgi:hypothetical protein
MNLSLSELSPKMMLAKIDLPIEQLATPDCTFRQDLSVATPSLVRDVDRSQSNNSVNLFGTGCARKNESLIS